MKAENATAATKVTIKSREKKKKKRTHDNSIRFALISIARQLMNLILLHNFAIFYILWSSPLECVQ